MASAAVHTPVRSYAGVFSTRTAGGRVPLIKSPLPRATPTNLPFTPPRTRQHDPEWHIEKKRPLRFPESCISYDRSLVASFAQISISGPLEVQSSKTLSQVSPVRAPRLVASPKSNIAGTGASPLRLELAVSQWGLAGSNSIVNTPAKNIRNFKTKAHLRARKKIIRFDGGRDRFIPNRNATSPTAAMKALRAGTSRAKTSRCNPSRNSVLQGGVFGTDHNIIKSPSTDDDDDDIYTRPDEEAIAFQSSVAAACGLNLSTRILAFKPKTPPQTKSADARAQYNRPLRKNVATMQRRRIQLCPERVLDAPGISDDFNLNLLDWSSKDQIAIGLDQEVYIWNAGTGKTSLLMETSHNTYVSSVKWARNDGEIIAIGTADGEVQVWDIGAQKKLRTMNCHESHIGVMSWGGRGILSTGAASGRIFNHDVRIRDHKVSEFNSHSREVCGLEWRSDGAQLASGGNDNLLNIWDARLLTAPKSTKTNHRGAVKALAWCPWQINTLASGGGPGDGKIHFWNATTGSRLNSIDSGSQVTSLKWSTSYREIVSCHGYPDNQLTIWSYPTLARKIEIPAHESRILHSALSPDGQTLATCASDENLKFWKIFENSSHSGSRPSDRKASEISRQAVIR